MTRKIVAIGGGEFLDGETREIDSRILELVDKPKARMLFIPTASIDSVGYYESISGYFTNTIGFVMVDPLYVIGHDFDLDELRKTVFQYDAIYVGGGNTKLLLNEWRRIGLDIVLKEALYQGIVLSGISAGSICWFTQGNSDSEIIAGTSDKLIKIDGLGFIDAFHCPHYNEPAQSTNTEQTSI